MQVLHSVDQHAGAFRLEFAVSAFSCLSAPRYSNGWGFGVLNPSALVQLARSWTPVSPRIVLTNTIEVTEGSSSGTVSSVVTATGCDASGHLCIVALEHVLVRCVFEDIHVRGTLHVELKSPQGTSTVLLQPRKYDRGSGKLDWTFGTIALWDEPAVGQWELSVVGNKHQFTLRSWSLTMTGTAGPYSAASYPMDAQFPNGG